MIGYNAGTLAQVGAYCVTPDGTMAGIWQSGQPPSIDASGNVFVMTGNGSFDSSRNFGESIVKLTSDLSSVLDWFTPDNWNDLNAADADLGSSGVLLIPGTNDVIGGGKSGTFFLLDRSNLGHTQSGNGQIVQSFQATAGGHIHGSPVYWNGPNGPVMYVWGEADNLKGFSFSGSTFNPTPATQSTFTAPPGMPGGFLALSASGSTAGSGILWAALPYADDAENAAVSGVLRAFDASDLSRELWNSRMNAARDDLGNFAKYVPPTVANGRVYLASFSNQLNVYGLIGSPPPPSPTPPPGGAVASKVTVTSSTSGTSTVGQAVTFVATVAGSSPTGTITCADGSARFAPNVPLANGSASCATSSLTAGTHTITVTYSGDANNAPSTGTITQTVNAASASGGGGGSVAGASGGGGGGGGGGGCTVNAFGPPDWTLILIWVWAGLYRLRRRFP